MWIWSLLLLSLSGGILGKNEEFCRDDIRKVCLKNQISEFPSSEEDLDEVCRVLQDRLTCEQDYQIKCGASTSHDYELPKVIAFVNDLCKNGSKLRTDVVKELPCIKEFWDNKRPECSEPTMQALTEYERHKGTNDEESREDREYREGKLCLLNVCTTACLIAGLDRECGAGAKELALETHNRLGVFDSVCSAQAYDDLLQLIPVMEIQAEQQAVMRDIILLEKNA